MPRYFFHIENGKLLPDDLGEEFPDLDAVKRFAVTYSGDVLRESGESFWKADRPWRLRVTDEAHQLVFSLELSADEPRGTMTYRPAE